MGPHDFQDLMTARPFRPFFLRLRSGESVEVKRNLTGFSAAKVLFVGDDYGPHGHPERIRRIPFDDVAGYDYVEPAKAAG